MTVVVGATVEVVVVVVGADVVVITATGAASEKPPNGMLSHGNRALQLTRGSFEFHERFKFMRGSSQLMINNAVWESSES